MLQAGQILHGRYQLQKQLGHSANRQTWLAHDLATLPHEVVSLNAGGNLHWRCHVIVKLLSFVGEVQWDTFKLFEREAQVLQQLNHPRIPKYRDYFCLEERSLWFGLVQEYIPGSSLQELLHTGKKFTEQQIYQIAVDVLHILIYLHELTPSVLHRDIKPSNLIWGNNQQIYLVDFGAVQVQAMPAGVSFTVVGTYGYTPLEQFGGKAVPASDLYALAATLIHLSTGIAPADLPQRNLQFQFTQLVSLSPKLVYWLQQLSAPAVERRFSTARLALANLEDAMCRDAMCTDAVCTDAMYTDAMCRDAIYRVSTNSLLVNNSGRGLFDLSTPVPQEIKGWNWGAFLLTPFWLVNNRVWIGCFALVPIVGFWMAIALGIKGNEWAWKSRKWESVDLFISHQKRWAIAGIIFGLSANLIVWHISILLLLSTLMPS